MPGETGRRKSLGMQKALSEMPAGERDNNRGNKATLLERRGGVGLWGADAGRHPGASLAQLIRSPESHILFCFSTFGSRELDFAFRFKDAD